MQFLNKLNTTVKFLILVAYTLIITGVAVAITKAAEKPVEQNQNFTTIPGDENIGIFVEVRERRTAANPDYENRKELSYWDVRLTLQKKVEETSIRNIHSFVTVETIKGDYIYKEKTKEDVFPSYDRINQYYNIIAKKSNTYKQQTDTFVKTDQEPKRVFIEVVYQTRENDQYVYRKINYKIDLFNKDNYDFSTFSKRNLNGSNYITTEDELYNFKLRKRITSKDYFLLEMDKDSNNLASQNISKATVRLAIFAKAANDPSDTENYFSDYIEFAQYFGDFVDVSDILNLTQSYDQSYNISKLYVISEIIPANSNSINSHYTIDVADLQTY